MWIYPVFYIALLEPAPRNTRSIIEPVEFEEEKETFEVERILATRIVRNRVQYLVQWKGYPILENT